MSDLDEEMLADFLLEGWEQIETLDQEFVRLEEDSEDLDRVENIFRVMHTLKGGAGFLSLPKLEMLTHQAESLLSLVREGTVVVNQPLINLLLESADKIKAILTSLEKESNEGEHCCESLIERLEAAACGVAPETVGEPAEGEERTEVDAMESFQAELLAALDGGSAKPAAEAPPEPTPKPAQEAGRELVRQASSKQIRVKVELLDKLMNLVGELVLSRNQLLQLSGTNESPGMEAACQRINLVTSELQDNILQARMQPIDTILKKFPRLVRDLASQTGKEIRLTVEGEETALDRTILEAIKDPLTHILRNSIDHGLETPEQRRTAGKSEQGNIHIRAFHEGGQVTIEFIDNGRGVDLEKVRNKAVSRGLMTLAEAQNLADREVMNLLFHPGFSTADKVTNLSGRGVGMDVVKTSTEAIGGTIDIQSTSGEGTVVRLRLPLTLAIIPALVVVCAGHRYAIPQVSLQEMVRLQSSKEIESLYGGEVYRLRGELLPLLRLRNVLGLEEADDTEEVNVVVIRSDNVTFGLIVDDVIDTEEIVVKPLSRELKVLDLYAGATIMGDGRIALILDVSGLAKSSSLEIEEQRLLGESELHASDSEPPGQSLLLFTLAEQIHAVPLSLVSRLEEIPRERLEMVSGRPMVHYREKLLPLVDLSYELGQGESLDRETLQVLVFVNGNRSLGLAVDTILDVVEQKGPVEVSDQMPGLLGSTVLEGRAVAIVDAASIIANSQPRWMEPETKPSTRNRILLAGKESVFLNFCRSYLETAGHYVLSAEDVSRIPHVLEGQDFDCVLLDLADEKAEVLANCIQANAPDLLILGSNPQPEKPIPLDLMTTTSHSPSGILSELGRILEPELVGRAS